MTFIERVRRHLEAYRVKIYEHLNTVNDCVYWLEYYRLVYWHMEQFSQFKGHKQPMKIAKRHGLKVSQKLQFLAPDHPSLTASQIDRDLPIIEQYLKVERLKP